MEELFGGFFKGKNILITGHTGFKGSWLSIWLHELGANVIGFALEPTNEKDNFVLSKVGEKITNISGDIRSLSHLDEVFKTYEPEIVFHLAAQPIVLESYVQPHYTYDVNVMGTLNVLERIKESENTKVGIFITSDKCYKNKEWIYGYRENDELGGNDLYSSSKGCAEILVASYRSSFFNKDGAYKDKKVISTVRAGNVIGGGDWSLNRIIPDCIRALENEKEVVIRNPHAIRPWQHVLDPLYGYLLLASKCMGKDADVYSDAWNFGPDFNNIIPVAELVEKVAQKWKNQNDIIEKNTMKRNEAVFLNIDSTKAKYYLGFQPVWNMDKVLDKTLEWYKGYKETNVYDLCVKQIKEFCDEI